LRLRWLGAARLPDRRLCHRDLFQTQSNHQLIQQLVVQLQSIRDLIGFDEIRLGFWSDFVGQVLTEFVSYQIRSQFPSRFFLEEAMRHVSDHVSQYYTSDS
jgi:hypothetical protein